MADADLGEPLSGAASSTSAAPDSKATLMALSVASLCELIAASVVCAQATCDGLDAYAVVVGCVSLAACLPLLLLHFEFFNAEDLKVSELAPHLVTFLLIWWVVAWFTLTFISPFAGLSNGFFACWVAPPAALLLCRATNPGVAAALGRMVALVRGSGAQNRLAPIPFLS